MAAAALTGAAICIAAPAAAQRDFSSVEIEAEEVANGVYVLYGAGGNIGLSFGEDAVFLVDDQFAPLTDRIQAKVSELAGAGAEVDFLVNTHWHGDHTGGNENFGEAGALIVAHDNVRRRMAAGSEGEREVAPAPKAALPVMTFRDRQSFHINGGTLRAVYAANAHTDGDALIHFVDQNVIHMGDTFFAETAGTFPFIDRASGGSAQGLLNAADLGLKLANEETKIIPGHGKVTDRAGLAAYRDFLAEMIGAVQAMIDEGRSRDEIVAARPAAAYADARSGGFISEDRFVGFVYDSLTEPAAHSHEDGTTHAH
ncbi:hypothetical protein B5C34_01180 [Pacificimonas flava]|uniref:Metallo-beta-lactamase domain-containing protein n=2 Tax=Pacificimonas TaxID=1960290 RepID=A0A219B8G3_9SPHN|nr:hypothetical protein B5C34_01180 [Pacificimonas flava]